MTAMHLPAFSRHFAVALMAMSQSTLVVAQSSAPQKGEAASEEAAVSVPSASALVVSEFFVPKAKIVDASGRTIALPSGAVATVPVKLWLPNKLLKTTEGPVQLPPNVAPIRKSSAESPDPTVPQASSLPKTGWKNANSRTYFGGYLTVVQRGRVMTRNRLPGTPQDWAYWCECYSAADRHAGVIPPGYKWIPMSDGRAVAVPVK